MTTPLFGYPSSDSFSRYIDREGDGQRNDDAAEKRERFGEVAERVSEGPPLAKYIPLTDAEIDEMHDAEQAQIDLDYDRKHKLGEFSPRAFVLPTRREMEEQTRGAG